MFGLMKACVLWVPMAYSNAMVSACGQGFWMDVLLDYIFFQLISPVMHTWIFLNTYTGWALGRCVTAYASEHVVSVQCCTTSFYSCGSRSSGSKIWANVDRSWWPDCLACMFIWSHSARLLPVRPHEELDLRDPCGFRERSAGAGYSCSRC